MYWADVRAPLALRLQIPRRENLTAWTFPSSDSKATFLVISISSDWLNPPYQCKEIAEALSANDIDVRNCEIRSNYGHDAFLLESGQMNYTIQNFLSRTSVGDVMIREIVTVRQGSSVEVAARIMMTEGVTHQGDEVAILPPIAGG
jgi:hypothetical protein